MTQGKYFWIVRDKDLKITAALSEEGYSSDAELLNDLRSMAKNGSIERVYRKGGVTIGEVLKPTPKFLQMKLGDIPVGAVLSRKLCDLRGGEYLVTHADLGGVQCGNIYFRYSELGEHWQYRLSPQHLEWRDCILADAYAIVEPPKFRPLRCGDIRSGTAVRRKTWTDEDGLVIATSHNGVCINGSRWTWEGFEREWQMWSDAKQAWVDCRVEEGEV